MRFPALETERLRLRSPQSSDATGFAELLSDPGSHPFISDSGPLGAAAIPGRIRALRISFRLGRSVHWVLESRSNGEFLGFVAIHRQRKEPSYLSYAIRESFRRQRFASEALVAVCANLATIGCRILVARTHVGNTASRNLLRSLGFEECGCVDTPGGRRVEYRYQRTGVQ